MPKKTEKQRRRRRYADNCSPSGRYALCQDVADGDGGMLIGLNF